jgi:deazaflavin-dependent oxidoreductase (nitroreductase family)
MRYMNRFLMVPAFRLGLGGYVVSPYSGYIMVLKTRGHLSGQTRYAPVNYAIRNGNIYCAAGWGPKTHWFANLKADPRVELLLPGRSLAGVAEEVTCPEEAVSARVAIVRNAGFAAFFGGLNPFTMTDEQASASLGDAPVVRIHPCGTAPSPLDPGEWGWVLPQAISVAGTIWLFARLARLLRRK